MADTFEYPPSLASHYPVILADAGVVPAIYQLCHHFFVSRFKMVMQTTFDNPCSRDSVIGLQHELSVLLASHGACSVLGLSVPSPYFLQEVLLSSITGPYDNSVQHFVHRLIVGAEVSERDQAFVKMVCDDDNPTVPTFFQIFQRISSHTKQLLIEQGIKDTDIPTSNSRKFLVELWVGQGGHSSKSDAIGRADAMATDTGGVEVVVEAAGPAATPKPVPDSHDQDLLLELGPNLSDEDQKDFALLGLLTQTLSRQQRNIGLETEIVERGRWNCEAASQLIELAQTTSSIPFADREALHDLRPTRSDTNTVPVRPAADAKGKQRDVPRPMKRSIYSLLPMDTNTWTGPKVDPLQAKPIDSDICTFNSLLAMHFPALFGIDAAHHCVYRDNLFGYVADDLQKQTAKHLAEEHLSGVPKGGPVCEYRPSRRALNTAAKRAAHISPRPPPPAMAATASSSLTSLPSTSSYTSPPGHDSNPSMSHRSPAGLPPHLVRRPSTDDGESLEWGSGYSSEDSDEETKGRVDFVGPGVTFSTMNTM